MLCLAAAAALVAGACSGGGPADDGDFVLSFAEAPAELDSARSLVDGSGAVRDLIDGLNESFALPGDIPVDFDVSDEGPSFDPETNSILVPYGFVAETRALFASGPDPGTDEEIDGAAAGTVAFVTLHEAGHALIENLDLPVTGREEDAVDGLAAALLIEAVDGGEDILLATADWFAMAADERGDAAWEDYADEHTLDEQRYFQLLCWVYGSDPQQNAWVVDDEHLPADRADGCPGEYERNVASWERLLEPWTKP